MDNRLKRFLSLALAIVMVIGMMPANIVFATEEGGNAPNSGENIEADGNGGDTSEQGTTGPTEQDPAQVPALLSDGEGAGHTCTFTLVVEGSEVAATETTPATKTMKCEFCDETQVVKTGCATLCTIKDTVHTECQFNPCDDTTGCDRKDGHSGLCTSGGQILIGDREDLVEVINSDRTTIKLTHDLTLTEEVTIPEGKTVELDLNGKTINVGPFEENPAPDYALINKGNLTVIDTATGTDKGTVYGIRNGSSTGETSAVLTIKGGTFTANGANFYAIHNYDEVIINKGTFGTDGGYALGNAAGAEMTIDKDPASSMITVAGVYNEGQLMIADGTFSNSMSGKHAVWSHTGYLEITGGAFTGRDTTAATIQVDAESSAALSDSTYSATGDGVALMVLSKKVGDTTKDVTLTNVEVSGGIVVGDEANLIIESGLFGNSGNGNSTVAATAHVTVNGGTYNDANSQNFVTPYAAPGKILVFVENGKNVLKVKSDEDANTVSDVIATIGSGSNIVGYPSLESAVKAAAVDATVKIVADTTLTASIEVKKNVTLIADADRTVTISIDSNSTDSAIGGLHVTDGMLTLGQSVTITNISGASGVSTVFATGTTAGVVVNGAAVISENNNGAIVAAGGAQVTVAAGEVASATMARAIYAKDGAAINVTGGRIYGAVAAASEASLVISGGTFTLKPAAQYIQNHYEVVATETTDGVLYVVQQQKVDLEKPANTAGFVNYAGTGNAPANANQVLADIKENANINTVTVANGYTLVITPKGIEIEADETENGTFKTSRITYEVHPEYMNGGEAPGHGTIKFQLPIPGSLPGHVTTAYVYHAKDNQDDLYQEKYRMRTKDNKDEFPVQYTVDSNNKKWYYVEIESANFSNFGIELIDVDPDNDLARIGVKGYATVQAAVNAVRNGETIHLLTRKDAQGRDYGNVRIVLDGSKKFTIDGHNYLWLNDKVVTVNSETNETVNAIISISGGGAMKSNEAWVEIKNVRFSTARKSGAVIDIDSDGKYSNVLIEDCSFEGIYTSEITGYTTAGINLNNTKGVKIKESTGTKLDTFLKNTKGGDLTVVDTAVTSSRTGMNLGAVDTVALTRVTINVANNQAGIILDGSVNNNVTFTDCNITAFVPIVAHNTTEHGRYYFNSTENANNVMTPSNSGNWWFVLSDEQYVGTSGQDPATMKTSGHIIITVNDDSLATNGINYRHVNGNKYYTVAPEGKLTRAVVVDDAAVGDSYIAIDIGELVSSESVILEIHDESGLIATSTLAYTNVHQKATVAGGVAIAKIPASWTTDWTKEEDCPTYRNVPAKAYLIVDGKVLNENTPISIAMNAAGAPARLWTDIEGVGNLTLTTGGKTTWKHTLAEAFTAVDPASSGTVKLYDDNTAILSAKGEITGGKKVSITTVDYKGDGITPVTLDWGDTNTEYLFVGRGANTGDGKLIFDAAHIKAAGNTPGAIGIHVSGARKENDKVNNGTLVVQNGSNIELDYLVNRNDVKVTGKGTTLTVRNGFASGGRPESEARDDAAKISTLTVEKEATLIIRDMTGKSATQHEGLGYEGIGKMLVDNATFIYEGEFHNAIGTGKMQVSGTSTLKLKNIFKGEAENGVVGEVNFGAPIELLNNAKLVYSQVGGEVTVEGTSSEASKAVKVYFAEKNTIETVSVKYAHATVSGELNTDSLNVLYGTVYTDTQSKINTKGISIGDGDQIKIDATNLASVTPVLVINQEQENPVDLKGRVSVTENATHKIENGDVYVYFEAYIDKNENGELDIGEGYATIEKAVEKAADGDKVILLADATVEAPVEISKNIVLELNTKTIFHGNTETSVLKVTASDATVKNGTISAYHSNKTGIDVAVNAGVKLLDVEVKGKVLGIKTSGNVTVGAGTVVTARYAKQQETYPAIIADGHAVVTIDGGTIGDEYTNRAIVLSDNASVVINSGRVGEGINGSAIELNDAASATINGGEVIGAPAVRVYGGTLTVEGGEVTRKHDKANAIVTSPVGVGENVVSNVIINAGEIDGWIIAEDVADTDVPNGYDVNVVITGGNFTNSRLDEDYIKKGYAEIAVSRAKADVPTTFDNFVRFEMIAPDFTCQKVKDINPVKYEIVPYEHVRIYMNNVDDGDLDGDGIPDYKIFVGDDAHVDGNPYEVQPGKVLLISKDLAKKTEMFITTYGVNNNQTPDDDTDDYPTAMYVWYAMGTDANKDGICDSYSVERVKELDGFFQYHGTSIRVGGSSNGIRFFSSVNANDANKLMSGTLITDADSALYGAKMVSAGTWFKKTNEARSEVYGGKVGKNFRVFQKYAGRNWFTGVLVGLENSAKNVAEPFQTRPFADIEVDGKTVTLYGGLLKRSIYYVATQNKDVFNGTSYDSFVENLIKMGYDYLHPTTPTTPETPAGGNG